MTIFVLRGPQRTGKSQKAAQLRDALGCSFIVDPWDGKGHIRDNTLAITNGDYMMPEGGVALHVEDKDGLEALISVLLPRAA